MWCVVKISTKSYCRLDGLIICVEHDSVHFQLSNKNKAINENQKAAIRVRCDKIHISRGKRRYKYFFTQKLTTNMQQLNQSVVAFKQTSLMVRHLAMLQNNDDNILLLLSE